MQQARQRSPDTFELVETDWQSDQSGRLRGKTTHTWIARAVLLTGLVLWLTITVVNNATDGRTNATYLGQMVSMAAIHGDPSSGQGLLWRAVDVPRVGRVLLYLVIALQLGTVVLLWRAAGFHYLVLLHRLRPDGAATRAATLALSAFISIWLFFMSGGMWFGYWLHMGPFRQVHMTLLIIGICALGYISLTEQSCDRSSR